MYRLLFFLKIRNRDFGKNRTKRGSAVDWEKSGTRFVRSRSTEGAALCAGNAKGRQLPAGVKGQRPLSGQG